MGHGCDGDSKLGLRLLRIDVESSQDMQNDRVRVATGSGVVPV